MRAILFLSAFLFLSTTSKAEESGELAPEDKPSQHKSADDFLYPFHKRLKDSESNARWICIGRRRYPKLGYPSSVVVTGNLGENCRTIDFRARLELAGTKSGKPVSHDDANVYCRKEEFIQGCK